MGFISLCLNKSGRWYNVDKVPLREPLVYFVDFHIEIIFVQPRLQLQQFLLDAASFSFWQKAIGRAVQNNVKFTKNLSTALCPCSWSLFSRCNLKLNSLDLIINPTSRSTSDMILNRGTLSAIFVVFTLTKFLSPAFSKSSLYLKMTSTIFCSVTTRT